MVLGGWDDVDYLVLVDVVRWVVECVGFIEGGCEGWRDGGGWDEEIDLVKVEGSTGGIEDD